MDPPDHRRLACLPARIVALDVAGQAGVDRVLPHLPSGVTLCNANGIHGGSVAEWVMAAVLGACGRSPPSRPNRPGAIGARGRPASWPGRGPDPIPAAAVGVGRASGQRRLGELLTLLYREYSAAAPDAVWTLLAEPAQWSRWAPHVRGAHGLGRPEVQVGRRGVVMLGGAAPIPVRITGKSPGRSWDWRVGLVDMRHEVTPTDRGSEVRVEITASRPIEAGLRISYGPLVALLLRNLARVAAG